MCISEINNLNRRNQLLVQEIKDTKSKYVDALSENFKRDFTIDQLKKQLDRLQQSSSSSGTMKETLLDSAGTVYGEFFSEDQLENLESIENSKSNDSKFILTAIRQLYADKLETVKGKSAAGRSKEPLSPEKGTALKEIFGKRLDNIGDSKEKSARMKKLNAHINCAFANISRSLQK